MKLFIVRHGEAETGDRFWNDDLGRLDPPLTEKGREQSRRLKEYFRNINMEAIYVSQFRRTMETVRSLAKEKGIVPVIDGMLNEIDTGLFARMDDEERKRKFPDEWACLNVAKKDFAYPDGESGKDVLERVKAVFGKLKAKSGNVLIVTHEGWVKIAICHILDLDPGERFHFLVDNCGILELEYDKETDYWRIAGMNRILQDR